jgi:two-component system heavy metal sensor histidine kinase CusS
VAPRVASGRRDGRPVVHDTVADKQSAASAAATTIEVPDDLNVGVSPQVVTRTLTPVLGNAYRYAGQQVRVRGRRRQDTVKILFADDGPGVPDHFRADLFLPAGVPTSTTGIPAQA